MKRLFLPILLFLPLGAFSQWTEDFSGLPNGTENDNGSTKWTTNQPNGSSKTFSKQEYPGFIIFAVNDTGNEGVWISEEIDISSLTEAAIEITWGSYWANSSDYLRAYYKLDGGPEVLFGEETGKPNLRIGSAASAIVSGNTLQIIIRGKENTLGFYGGYPRMMGIDDVAVSQLTYLYSRSSGNWDSGNTWSATGYGGASCSCTPNQNTHVFAGNGRVVNLNASAQAAGVTVEASGRINYTANAKLDIVRGGVLEIASDGSIDKNANDLASIAFTTYNYHIDVNGSLSIGELTVNAANVSFTGSGQINLSGNLLLTNAAGKTVSNETDFNIDGEINFDSPSFHFINTGALTVNNRLFFNYSDITFTNNGSLYVGSGGIQVNNSDDDANELNNSSYLALGAINLNYADFILNNSGIIDQDGDFANIAPGSAFNNLTGAVWNFSGAGSNNRLFTSAPGNSFNYVGSGSQNIFTPADGAYNNLSLAGSETKTMTGQLAVSGDLEITGAAQLDASLEDYNLTVGGDWTATTSQPDPFIERSASTAFNGSGDQTIAVISGNEDFNSLVINKPSGALILASSPATDVEALNLSLASGSLDLNGNTLTIAGSGPAAISRTNGFIRSETSSSPYSRVIWRIGAGSGAYVFPFGKSDSPAGYIPFTFDVTSAGAGAGSVSIATFEASGYDAYPEGAMAYYEAEEDHSNDLMVDRVWQIDLNGFSTNPTAAITFKATPDEVGSNNSLRAQRWNASASNWDPPPPGQANPDDYSVTVPGLNRFSPWVMTDGSRPLPVELVYFKATPEGSSVKLEWQTASESNNDFFTIEKRWILIRSPRLERRLAAVPQASRRITVLPIHRRFRAFRITV